MTYFMSVRGAEPWMKSKVATIMKNMHMGKEEFAKKAKEFEELSKKHKDTMMRSRAENMTLLLDFLKQQKKMGRHVPDMIGQQFQKNLNAGRYDDDSAVQYLVKASAEATRFVHEKKSMKRVVDAAVAAKLTEMQRRQQQQHIDFFRTLDASPPGTCGDMSRSGSTAKVTVHASEKGTPVVRSEAFPPVNPAFAAFDACIGTTEVGDVPYVPTRPTQNKRQRRF